MESNCLTIDCSFLIDAVALVKKCWTQQCDDLLCYLKNVTVCCYIMEMELCLYIEVSHCEYWTFQILCKPFLVSVQESVFFIAI